MPFPISPLPPARSSTSCPPPALPLPDNNKPKITLSNNAARRTWTTPDSSVVPTPFDKRERKNSETQEALKRPPEESASDAEKIIYEHLKWTQEKIDKKEEPPRLQIITYDKQSISGIVHTENLRKPDLNLTSGTTQDVAKSLTIPPSFHQRFVFRENTSTSHHIFADIHSILEAPLSIILIEPVYCEIFRLCPLIGYLKKNLPDAHVSIINANIQHGAGSCAMFSLFFALKSYKHKDIFLKWHDAQHKGQPIEDQQADCLKQDKSLLNFPISSWRSSVLPPAFIKHAQSRTVIREYLKTVSEEDLLTHDMLNQNMSLQEERTDSNDKSSTRSVSCEYKRRNLLLRTLKYIKANEDGKPSEC